MKKKETFFEALSNPNSKFRTQMLEYWKEYLTNKENKNGLHS